MDDGFTVPTNELFEAALINFKNTAKMVPGVANHPIFHMAVAQLEAAIARLNAEIDAE